MRLKMILVSAASIMMLAACCSTKKVETTKNIYTAEMQKIINQYPEVPGFDKRAIFLSKLSDEEQSRSKVEIIPGRELLVDCNQHGLQGTMLTKIDEKSGYRYFQYNSNGEIFSTQMRCPDDTKTKKFIAGQTILTEYRSDLPIIVYTSPVISVKYCLWKSEKEYSVNVQNNSDNASNEAISNAKYYPEIEGYVKHILYLPPLGAEEVNRKVEIIPGKTLLVDCNKHHMSGKILVEQIKGFGYDYYKFESDGNYSSTRMACPGQSPQNKFVSGETMLIRYNSRLPIVVYTPAGGFEVNYKIWATNGKMY